MSAERFPAIEELIPQRGRMSLLGRVLEHSPDETTCELDPQRSEPFCDEDGNVPAYVALEYMAQCAAAHASLADPARNGPPRVALLLGSRRLEFAAQCLRAGRALRVCARHVRGESGLVVFDCTLRESGSEEPLARGRVNLYTVAEGDTSEASSV